MRKLVIAVYGFIIIAFVIFSYGFTDANLQLSHWSWYEYIHTFLFAFVNYKRLYSTLAFLGFLLSFFGIYIWALKNISVGSGASQKKIVLVFLAISCLLVFAYPAVSYDIFNYISTAKLAFTHHENPYVIMPVEIPHEPFLAFTRAANKTALYGPVWVILSYVPWVLSGENIWAAIIMFKFMNGVLFLIFAYFIYVVTGSYKNIIFFALNPLVLIEVLVAGHNDIYMMVFALSGFWFWSNNKKILGLGLFIASWLIKGATAVLLPLLMVRRLSWEKTLLYSYWLLFILFIIVAPLREELYPWYAVWIISIASLLQSKKYSLLMRFTIALSLGLELRHLPYMWMGYYEGIGPLLRILFTLIPVISYLSWVFLRNRVKLSYEK